MISKNGDDINWGLEDVLATPRRLRERPQCGAKTRSGAPCKNAATIISRRCRMHGGAGSGAPLGNRNAYKHGRYSRESILARRKIAEMKRAAAAQEENSMGPENDLAFMRDALAGLSREPAATEETAAAESTPPDQTGQHKADDPNDDIDALVGPEETERILARLRRNAAAETAQRRDATAKAGRTSVAADRNK